MVHLLNVDQACFYSYTNRKFHSENGVELFSQLSRLFRLLTNKSGQEKINAALSGLDGHLKGHDPVVQTRGKIDGRYQAMLGAQLKQSLDVALSPNDFHRLASRLSLVVDSFEIDQNGLGFNNLIYMAVVLSELTVNPDACYRSLIVEEPESHLHPQLQAVLLQYLESIHRTANEKPVQLFVTSHSPNFASIADLNSLVCLVETSDGVQVFCPRNAEFGKHKREKLQRYLDVTRAELFFARRIIFVEGAAELMLVSVFAKKIGVSLREHGVSLISVEGLNFDCFLPLFGEKGLKIPVSVVTDADPEDCVEGGESSGNLSDNTNKLKEWEDSFVKVFHGSKTLEYDLALCEDNRKSMLKALRELHPRICLQVQSEVDSACGNEEKADALYSGMFRRSGGSVLKGRFAQSLAHVLSEEGSIFQVPVYITNAINHACRNEVPKA